MPLSQLSFSLSSLWSPRRKRDVPEVEGEIENPPTKKRPKPPEPATDPTTVLPVTMKAPPPLAPAPAAASVAAAPPPSGPGLVKKRVIKSGPSVPTVKHPTPAAELDWRDEPMPTVGALLREGKVLTTLPDDGEIRIRFMTLDEEQALRFESTRKLRRDTEAAVQSKPIVRCPAFRVLPPESPLPPQMLSRRSERLLELCDSDSDEEEEGEEVVGRGRKAVDDNGRRRSARNGSGEMQRSARSRSRSSSGEEGGKGEQKGKKEGGGKETIDEPRSMETNRHERHNIRDRDGKFIRASKVAKSAASANRDGDSRRSKPDNQRAKEEGKDEEGVYRRLRSVQQQN